MAMAQALPNDGVMRAADGTPLKVALARAERREKLKAMALVLPGAVDGKLLSAHVAALEASFAAQLAALEARVGARVEAQLGRFASAAAGAEGQVAGGGTHTGLGDEV